MDPRRFTLSLLAQRFAVCRLDPHSTIPEWATAGPLFCMARTPDELSIVCAEEQAPAGTQSAPGWRALKLHGPFAFTETGVLASLVQPLATAGVGVFVFSTYDTDYVLVKQEQLDAAVAALRRAGHAVNPP
jgi:hypothetical protein